MKQLLITKNEPIEIYFNFAKNILGEDIDVSTYRFAIFNQEVETINVEEAILFEEIEFKITSEQYRVCLKLTSEQTNQPIGTYYGYFVKFNNSQWEIIFRRPIELQ